MKILSLIITIMFFCSSCCSIVQGRTQKVGISSNPSGAEAEIDGMKIITPKILNLERNKNYKIDITKEGYYRAGAIITGHLSGWLWGNVLLGGLIGMAIDFATGAAYKLEPKNVQIELERK